VVSTVADSERVPGSTPRGGVPFCVEFACSLWDLSLFIRSSQEANARQTPIKASQKIERKKKFSTERGFQFFCSFFPLAMDLSVFCHRLDFVERIF